MVRGKLQTKPVRLDAWIGDNLWIAPLVVPNEPVDKLRAMVRKSLLFGMLGGHQNLNNLGMIE